MCGFVGFTDHPGKERDIVGRMMARIVHRGPDMGGKIGRAHV